MIPSRSRLNGWNFDGILSGATTVKNRGEAVETAASQINTRCAQLPALRGWDGTAHTAASQAYERAKRKSIVVGDLADGLSAAMTQGYWNLTTAKKNIVDKAAEIESGNFNVGDSWVVTIKPIEMTVGEARAALERRNQLQVELNLMVVAMGAADDSTSNALLAAAKAQGFVMEQPDFAQMMIATLNGLVKPDDDVPNPLTFIGARDQRAIADADAALTVASEESGTNADGEPTKTVHMQDGSTKVFTETETAGGKPMTSEQDYDPTGKLVVTTNTFPWGESGATMTSIRYAQDQTLVELVTYPNGQTSGTIYPQGKADQAIPADSQFFSHPALTSLGGVLSATETYGDDALAKSLPTLTKNSFENLHAGAKYGGLGLATGIALYDVATADSPGDKCRAAISGAMSVAGGWGGGALGAAVPVPGLDVVTAGAGGAGGSWLFGWVGSEIGKAVCYG